MQKSNGPQRIRELLSRPGIIRSLGAHDVFTALIVEQAGFETVFIAGFGTSASMLGLPDLNQLGYKKKSFDHDLCGPAGGPGQKPFPRVRPLSAGATMQSPIIWPRRLR